jgi:hypothetical protein
MNGQNVHVIFISAYGFVYLSNGDVLHCNKRWGEKLWVAVYKITQFAQITYKTSFKEALEVYKERTGNILAGTLDVNKVQEILDKQVSWKEVTHAQTIS